MRTEKGEYTSSSAHIGNFSLLFACMRISGKVSSDGEMRIWKDVMLFWSPPKAPCDFGGSVGHMTSSVMTKICPVSLSNGGKKIIPPLPTTHTALHKCLQFIFVCVFFFFDNLQGGKKGASGRKVLGFRNQLLDYCIQLLNSGFKKDKALTDRPL